MAEATIDPVQTGIPTGTGPITADLGTIVPRAARRFGSKTPRSVRFVADLPKTSTGKVMRRELKTLDR
jgi:acyl-coenzyme A synthetase/AMP-(fatty) acid ligase